VPMTQVHRMHRCGGLDARPVDASQLDVMAVDLMVDGHDGRVTWWDRWSSWSHRTYMKVWTLLKTRPTKVEQQGWLNFGLESISNRPR
jgi:hypothetical protein